MLGTFVSGGATPQGGGLFGTQAPQSAQSGGLFSGTTPQPSQTGGLFGSSSSQPAQGGGLFGTASLQPAQSGGLFGTTPSQPAQSGGLFGAAPSQPAQSGGLFGAAPSQPAQSGGLFGTPSSQPSQLGGLFGAPSQPAQPGGLFGSASSETSQKRGLFGSTDSQPSQAGGLFSSTTSNPAQGGGIFGTTSSQPTASSGLFGTTATTTQAPSLGLFGQPSSAANAVSQFAAAPSIFGGGASTLGGSTLLGSTTTNKPFTTGLGSSLNLGLGTSTTTSTGAKIDLDHLRPTTKYDQLTEPLQNEISQVDTFILSQMQMCHEVAHLLPEIASSGANLSPDVAYVSEKLQEVEAGLENDADEIVELREKIVQRDANEAKVCFRSVDRLKMPAQYQSGVVNNVSAGMYAGSGLGGWWNNPSTQQRSIRGVNGTGGSRLPLPGEEEDSPADGPTSLVELVDRRVEEMKLTLKSNQDLLAEIEEFVGAIEMKILDKERELNNEREGVHQPAEQVRMLRYVFGAVEGSLYDVADKVGAARDGVREVALMSLHGGSRSRLGW